MCTKIKNLRKKSGESIAVNNRHQLNQASSHQRGSGGLIPQSGQVHARRVHQNQREHIAERDHQNGEEEVADAFVVPHS